MQPSARRVLNCGEVQLELGRQTRVMGILNVTPDSFSDGGRYATPDAAVRQAMQMVAEGAELIDIGGESTRPGAAAVSLEEELKRVIPAIEAIRKETDVPLSIDTYKAEVARQALQAGASIVNDVWGFKADPDMAKVAAAAGCPVILMHNRSKMDYRDFIEDVKADLLESVSLARSAGIRDDRIVLDPGIGFAKTYEHNLELMGKLSELAGLGFPLLLGTSRKSFIRQTLQLPADEVVFGTAATVALGIMQGCELVRVHDVGAIVRTVRMTDAIVRFRLDEGGRVHG